MCCTEKSESEEISPLKSLLCQSPIWNYFNDVNDLCFSEYLNVKLRRRTSEREVESAAVEIDHTYTQKVADAAVQVNSEERGISEIVKGYVQCSFFIFFVRILCVTHPCVLHFTLILGESQAKSLRHCGYKARGFMDEFKCRCSYCICTIVFRVFFVGV